MEHFNLIIKNATICTMDADMRVIQNGYVAVKGSDIATIAEGQVPGGITADKIVDASGQVLFPGLQVPSCFLEEGYLHLYHKSNKLTKDNYCFTR